MLFVCLIQILFVVNCYPEVIEDMNLFIPFSQEIHKEKHVISWDLGAFNSAHKLFLDGKRGGFSIIIDGVQEIFQTTYSYTHDNEDIISWLGSKIMPNHVEWIASISVHKDGIMLGHLDLGDKIWNIVEHETPFKAKLVQEKGPITGHSRFPPPNKIPLPKIERDIVENKYNGKVGAATQKLRVMLLFNVRNCTNNEKVKATNIDKMFLTTFTNNMKMTNYDIVYACTLFSPGTPTYEVFERTVRSSQVIASLRREWGGDLMMAIGDFTYQYWWQGRGDLGPSPNAFVYCTNNAAGLLYTVIHEFGHNFGMDHDRYNSFNGTYFCNTNPAKCNFGYQDKQYMSIMAYGTAQGKCPTPTTNNRIYVFSGYSIPNNPSKVLGIPCGTASGAWNRRLFEDNWDTIANYQKSTKCINVCPKGAPGCICR